LAARIIDLYVQKKERRKTTAQLSPSLVGKPKGREQTERKSSQYCLYVIGKKHKERKPCSAVATKENGIMPPLVGGRQGHQFCKLNFSKAERKGVADDAAHRLPSKGTKKPDDLSQGKANSDSKTSSKYHALGRKNDKKEGEASVKSFHSRARRRN